MSTNGGAVVGQPEFDETKQRVSTRRRRSIFALGATCVLAILAAVAFAGNAGDDVREQALLASYEPLSGAVVAVPLGPPVPPLATRIVRGAILKGGSLGRSLTSQGVSAEKIHEIDRGMAPVFDFRKAHPGDHYRLLLHEDGSVIDFRYSPSTMVSYHLFREGNGFVAEREQAQLWRRTARLSGEITSTFFESMHNAGEGAALATAFADLFSWDIDFSRDVHSGDRFQLLYERLYRLDDNGSEIYVRPGQILAARYVGNGGTHTAIYYEREGENGGYYRENGSSIERQFLKSPLKAGRMTSPYTMARRHPILHITRPHQGIDYAASEGAPIWAVADGIVSFKGRDGGFGRTVKVRHTNGYVSYYTHMSGYAKGLHVGQRISQKEPIGFVGHSGLATGPHICFRIMKNGHYMNPNRVASPPAAPVSEAELAGFRARRDQLLALLDRGSERDGIVALVADGSTSL